MVCVCLILFSGCATNDIQTRYLVNKIVPVIQPEEADMGELEANAPSCLGDTNGDMFNCEQELLSWLCINAVKSKIFAGRATENPEAIKIPGVCN